MCIPLIWTSQSKWTKWVVALTVCWHGKFSPLSPLSSSLRHMQKVLRTDLVMDVGRSLNPAIDIGQIEGAFAQVSNYLTFTIHNSSKEHVHKFATQLYRRIAQEPRIDCWSLHTYLAGIWDVYPGTAPLHPLWLHTNPRSWNVQTAQLHWHTNGVQRLPAEGVFQSTCCLLLQGKWREQEIIGEKI